ncbi:hypothetical protein V2I01_36540 [Micromonospora sp. BRA006-A]|nr:hypothetical protein [Micromonospora sp. BRA006-A]
MIDTRTGAVLARYRFAEAPRRRRSSTTSRSPVTPPGSPTRTGRCSTACRWDAAEAAARRRLHHAPADRRLPAERHRRQPQRHRAHPGRAGADRRAVEHRHAVPGGPATGVTTTVDVPGTTFVNGDGLLLLGRTLYVVQNRLNQVAVVELNRAGTAGAPRGSSPTPASTSRPQSPPRSAGSTCPTPGSPPRRRRPPRTRLSLSTCAEHAGRHPSGWPARFTPPSPGRAAGSPRCRWPPGAAAAPRRRSAWCCAAG